MGRTVASLKLRGERGERTALFNGSCPTSARRTTCSQSLYVTQTRLGHSLERFGWTFYIIVSKCANQGCHPCRSSDRQRLFRAVKGVDWTGAFRRQVLRGACLAWNGRFIGAAPQGGRLRQLRGRVSEAGFARRMFGMERIIHRRRITGWTLAAVAWPLFGGRCGAAQVWHGTDDPSPPHHRVDACGSCAAVVS